MKGVIYARESSADSKNAPSVDGQIEIGKTTFESLKHEIVDIYKDVGFSGADWERPEWLELTRDARLGRFDFIWVWAQDRLARDTELFRNIYRTMNELNIRIFVGSSFEEILMDTTGGMVKHTAIALSHEIFRTETSEKVRKAYLHRKEIAEKTNTLLKWGRNPVPKEIKDIAYKLRAEHPDWGVRKIAAALPPYPLALKPGETKPRMGKASYGWVYNLFYGSG